MRCDTTHRYMHLHTYGPMVLRIYIICYIPPMHRVDDCSDSNIVGSFLRNAQLAVRKWMRTYKNSPRRLSSDPQWTANDDTRLLLLAKQHTRVPSGGDSSSQPTWPQWDKISSQWPHRTREQCKTRWMELCPDAVLAIERENIRRRQAMATRRGPRSSVRTHTLDRLGNCVKRAFHCILPYCPEKLSSRVHTLVLTIDALPGKMVLEYLKGGHTILSDNGKIYEVVVGTNGSHTRFSSHYRYTSIGDPYGLTICIPHLPVIHLLCGTIVQQKQRCTWIQLERTPMPSLATVWTNENFMKNVKNHFWDTIAHTFTGKQYGPFGSSSYSEKRAPPKVIRIGRPCVERSFRRYRARTRTAYAAGSPSRTRRRSSAH